MGTARVPHSGWGGSWSGKKEWDQIAVTALTIREVLKELGHHPEEVITRWDERGWLNRGRGRNRTRVVRVDGVSIRCYCISRTATDLALDD